MKCLADGRPQSFFEKRSTCLAAGLDGRRTDRQPASAQRFTDSVGLKDLKGFGDRIGVDRQLDAKGPDARQELAGDEHPIGHGEFDLPNNLLVDRDAVVGVDRKKHGGKSVAEVRH